MDYKVGSTSVISASSLIPSGDETDYRPHIDEVKTVLAANNASTDHECVGAMYGHMQSVYMESKSNNITCHNYVMQLAQQINAFYNASNTAFNVVGYNINNESITTTLTPVANANNEIATVRTFDTTSSSTTTKIIIGFGVGGGVLVLMVMGIMIVMFKRNRRLFVDSSESVPLTNY